MKRALSILLCVLMLLSVLPTGLVIADTVIEGEYDGTMYYEIADGEATITGCTDPYISGELVIPATIEGYPVTEIGSSAFWECRQLTSVVLPEGLKKIDGYAFYKCSKIASVNIPSTVTYIGGYAFNYCNLITEITLPEGLVTIDRYAFGGTSITELEIPSTVKTIGYGAFQSTDITEAVVPDTVLSVDGCLFGYCENLTTVTFGSGLSTLPDQVFYSCPKLTTVTIGKNVTVIEEDAFYLCDNISTVYVYDTAQKKAVSSILPNATVTVISSDNPDPFDGWTPISTVEELNAIRNDLNRKYYLTADIVFQPSDFEEGGAAYSDGTGWAKIGTGVKPFRGVLDGNGHTISGLIINDSTTSPVGFISYCVGTVQNLGLVDCSIQSTAAEYVGGIVGSLKDGGKVINCYTAVTEPIATADDFIVEDDSEFEDAEDVFVGVKGSGDWIYVGGIVGYKSTGTVQYCHNGVPVIADATSGAVAGGIAGYHYAGLSPYYCYNTGDITATSEGTSGYASAHGIAGSGSANECYNAGNILAQTENGVAYAGGIARSVFNCFNMGSVEANSTNNTAYAGGLSGYGKDYSESSTEYVAQLGYNIGSVTAAAPEGMAFAGAITGFESEYGTITNPNTYYLDAVENGCEAGQALTEEELSAQSTFTAFDFNTVWTMDGNADYPYPELQQVETVYEKPAEENVPMTVVAENGDAGVNVTWTANQAAAKYKVYQRYYASGAWSSWVLASTTANTSFTHTAAKNGLLYEYYVTAIDADGATLETVYSDTIMYLIATTTTLTNSASGIKVAWTTNTKAEAFNVYRFDNNEWVLLTAATGTSYTDTTAQDGVVYQYMVRAANGEYLSLGTESVILRLVSPTVIAENKPAGILMSWAESAAIAPTYNVYRSAASGSSWTSWEKIAATSETAYIDSSAVNAVKYRYMVRVSCGDTMSAATSGTIITRKTITSIDVTTLPKTAYIQGEALDLIGGILTVYYSDDTTEEVALTDAQVSGFDNMTLGLQQLTVTYQGKRCTLEVVVNEPVTVESITVTTLPNKTEYVVGEAFDPTGLVVMVNYTNGTSEEVFDYTISGYDSSVGTKTIAVMYETHIDTFEVTVVEKEIASIKVTTLPTTLTYVAGSTLDTTDMVVTVYYIDGTETVIADYDVQADLSTAGTKTVTVTFEGFTDTFDVTVLAKSTVKVTVSNASSGIKVTWTAKNAETYKVYQRYNAGEGWSTWSLTTSTSDTTFTHTAAKNGLQYEYRVLAFHSGIQVGAANSATITRVAAATVTGENTTAGIKLSWDGNTKADAFNVYRSYEENGGWSAWELFATTTDLTCTDTDVENGTKYRYMVRTQVGEDLSAGITGVVIQRLTGPTFTTVNTVSGIKIEWKANEFAAKYYVYRSKNTGTSWTEWKRIITTAATVYSDLDVVNGVQYRYMIRSVNGEYVSGAESGTFILRLSVSSLALTNKTGGIYVEWSANAHAKSYNLYRSEYVNDEWTAWGKPILTTTETNFLDETAVNGVKYRYMVRTVNGEYISGSKTGDILHRLETSTMTLENVSSGIKISWTPNAAASKYFIYRSAYENGAWTAWTKFIVASASTTSYTDYNVTNGVRYRYMVRTSKGEDQSATNASDPLRRLVTPSVKAAATTNGISLTWTANANAGSYQIYRRAYDAATGSYSDWELLATAVKDTTYLDTTATKGVTYQYTARPVNGTDIGAVRASGNVKW